jgi:hypothetical protein
MVWNSLNNNKRMLECTHFCEKLIIKCCRKSQKLNLKFKYFFSLFLLHISYKSIQRDSRLQKKNLK